MLRREDRGPGMGRGAAGAHRSGAPLKDGERPPAAPPAGLGRGGAPLSFSFLLQVKYSVTFAKNTTTSTALTQSTVTQGTSTVSPRPCVSVEPALGQPARAGFRLRRAAQSRPGSRAPRWAIARGAPAEAALAVPRSVHATLPLCVRVSRQGSSCATSTSAGSARSPVRSSLPPRW